MIKASRFITSALLVASLPAAAQHRQTQTGFSFNIPNNPYLSARQTNQLKQQLNNAFRFAQATQLANKIAAGNERLVAMSNYNYAAGSSTQFADSFRFVYGNSTRTSAYDFFYLSYDMDNSEDLPIKFAGSNTSFIHYDTVRHYTNGSSTNAQIYASRTYNGASKVTVADYPENMFRTYFEYDASGRVVKATNLDGSGGSGLDSSSRNFYFYNASGFLIKDSSESWDAGGGSWEPNLTTVFTNNIAGYPTRADIQISFLGISMTVFQVNATYNSNNMPVTSLVKILSAPFQPLENASRDTFAYSGNALVYQNSYGWDTLALNWQLGYEERRHLTAASLPDSIWQKSYDNGTPADTTIIKISYNSNNNPTTQTQYDRFGTTREFESRYYYASTVGVSGSPLKRDITIYPNPATDALRVNGISFGRFSIVNAAGQIMVTGTLDANSSISLQGLASGMYQLVATDAAGTTHVGSFVKH